MDPDILVVLDTARLGVFGVDLHKILLLQFGQPRVRPGLVAATLVLDETA